MDNINPYESPHIGDLIDQNHPPVLPVTLVDTLRTATALYLAHLLPISAITLMFWLPMELMHSYLTYFAFDAEDGSQSMWLAAFFRSVIGLIPDGAIMSIAAVALQGQHPKILAALEAGFAAWPRMFVTRLTVTASIVLAMILFVIPGIYIAVRTLLAEPIALAEHRGGMTAPGRSFQLTHGRFWRTFGLLCMVAGYLFGIGFVSQIPLYFLNHWLLYAGLNLLTDLLGTWTLVVLLTTYWSLAHAPES